MIIVCIADMSRGDMVNEKRKVFDSISDPKAVKHINSLLKEHGEQIEVGDMILFIEPKSS